MIIRLFKLITMMNVLVLVLIGILQINCVKINRLIVPEIASPTTLPVILDCDYSLEFPKDEGLVVKWFFNESVYPVYQWIPDAKPQELGILKGRLDLTYRASEERHKIHRALKLTRLDPELSGSYTCAVSTFSSEDSRSKRMIVFVPEKSLELKYSPFSDRGDDTTKILCYAEEVFPKPEIRLFLNNSEVENATVRYQETNNGLFNVDLTAEAQEIQDGTDIMCELHVKQVNHTVRKQAMFYKGWTPLSSASGPQHPTRHLLWIIIILFKTYVQTF